jgi:hypothetical protein
MSKKSNNNFTINKKVIWGIAPVVAICAVLFSKNKMGEVFLFLIGIAYGIYNGIIIGKVRK